MDELERQLRDLAAHRASQVPEFDATSLTSAADDDGRNWGALLAVAALIVALLVGGGYLLFGGTDDDNVRVASAPSSSDAATTTTPTTTEPPVTVPPTTGARGGAAPEPAAHDRAAVPAQRQRHRCPNRDPGGQRRLRSRYCRTPPFAPERASPRLCSRSAWRCPIGPSAISRGPSSCSRRVSP